MSTTVVAPPSPPPWRVPEGWNLTERGMSLDGLHALDAWIGLDDDGQVRAGYTAGREPDKFDPGTRALHDELIEELRSLAAEESAPPTGFVPDSVTGTEEREPMFKESDLRYDYPLDRDDDYPHLNIVNVGSVMRAGVHPPEMLVEHLLPVGVHATVYGAKENGKTWLVLAAVVKPLLLRGRTVVYIDKEMSRALIAERLALLGVPVEAVEQYFVYLELPSLTENKETRKQWAEMLSVERPALVLADASAGVLADAGLDENRTPDVLKWDAWYFASARRAGATTLMLDHTGHDSKGRARGASGKGAQAKVEFEVESRTPFDRERLGTLIVTRQKNTAAADIPERQGYELGGTPFRFERMLDTRVPNPAIESERDAEEKETLLAIRVREVIERAGDKGCSLADIEAAKLARAQVVRDVAKALAESDDSPVTTFKFKGHDRYVVPAEHRPQWESPSA